MADADKLYRKCKYCDRVARVNGDVCYKCEEKLVLVRRLVEAGQELLRILDELEENENDSQKGGGGDGECQMDQGLD